MKLLTTREQMDALRCVDLIRQAISSGDQLQILDATAQLAELTYIIGGLKELTRRCKT